VAHGEVERRGRNLVFTRASLHEASGSGRALATAVAVLAVIPPRKTDA
jgi:acyl-coenzyme A thioesterase PaaI-like protein